MPTCTPPTGIIISEFRLRGSSGVNDEFVELYNNTDAAVTICTADGSSGWAVASSDGAVRFVVPSNTTIPGRAHYLAVSSSYSLSAYAANDLSYSSDIPDNVGIALFNTANPANFTTASRLDAVGFTSDTNALYREGAGLTPIGTGNVEYTFRRSLGGTPADTNNNSADFQYLSTDGQFGSKLGAPGPENLGSPIQRNAHMPIVLLDTTVAGSVMPNRVRDLTSDPANNSTYGTLSIRRRIVNSTGVQVTRLRFRITTITTYPVPSGTADLRARTSTAFVTMNVNDSNTCSATGLPATPPCEVTVQGTTLEQPPNQPNGGGYNSSLSVALPQPLAAGASVNVQFLLGVQQTGSFQFFINVEASTDSASPRLDPVNQTGGEGEDPLSRNYNWNVPLVSLPGRAGLDLGLSLAYNSLVWIKSGSFMSFDDDRGFPSPGFRLGFPVIQPQHYNAQAAKNAFMLITPNGKRVELRQVGTTLLYEAADSSYLLLDTSTMTLRTTDGTQLSYEWKGSDFQCKEIKDRNGNFITITYTEFGRIDTVVDTLNRTLKFNYDSDYLSSITQVWTVNGAPVTHIWASFVYRNPNLTIQTNFLPGLTNVGPQNGSTLKVLSEVTLNDGSRFNFDYTSWGQVWKISNFAFDGHLLNYRSYNLPLDNSTEQTDCPRFTERRDWAKNWNRNESGIEQEAITQFAVPVSTSWTLPDGTPQTGMRSQVTLPDLTYHKIYFHGTAGTSSGWHRGLASLVETFDSGSALQKQSVTKWSQDTEFSYPLNPRVVETNVYDGSGSNRRRVTTGYTSDTLPSGSSCRLPNDIREFAADATTVLRRTQTDYRMHPTGDAAYLSRHIIGLVKEQRLYGVNAGAETLMSQVGFAYDETAIQGTDTPVKHDNTNYSASLLVGRSNLTSVKRYDVSNTLLFVTTSSKYNRAGAVVETTDPANHAVTISYTDAFAAEGTPVDPALSFATLAYPTTVTDADGYSSSARYNYDFGAVTWKQTPLPNTTVNTPGPQQKIKYDSLGRTERVTNLVNNAYTQFNYGPNYVESFASVNNVADEARSLQVFDGAGRVVAKAGNHPGSTGGFSGQLVHYDVMGRPIKQSNPTETSISISGVPILPYGWQATGDDAPPTGNGWVYTQQSYDWKGRPRITTNTDGTTKEATYSGCGCAGGEVVTLTDEGTLVDPVNTKKRQQKIYGDVLGRTLKTEVFNWDGAGPFGTAGTVYSATVNTYNARDQITQIRQYQGAEGSGTLQDTTMTYDGHGRLKTRHVPQQAPGTNTVWDYNADDTIQKVTDARNASQTFGYNNNRHLVNSITCAWPGGGSVPDPVTFDYDAAGNRISMTDGLGNAGYAYDQISRMTSETRTFTGVGTFNLSYGYNLAAQLTSITDHFGAQVGYVHDTAGRVTTVTGANFGNVSTYASNIQYRASGAVRDLDYGNTRSLSMTYNARLQPASFSVPGVMSKTYDYQSDGRLKFSHDLLNAQFDRSYANDHAGRITEALSGAEARNEGPTNSRPYQQSFVYDALGHLTERPVNKVWSGQGGAFAPTPQTYVNERNTAWEYDAEGNLTNSGVAYTIDAAGQTSRTVSITNFPPDGQPVGIYGSMMDLTRSFDGDGLVLRKVGVETLLDSDPEGNVTTTKTFHQVRSSVLGGKVVSEIGTDSEQRGFVYIGGSVLALQYRTTQTVNWEHRDAGNASIRMTSSNGSVLGEESAELDPLGNNAAAANTATPLSPRLWKLNVYPGFGGAGMNGGVLCTMDNIATPCSQVLSAVNSGIAGQCPDNDCSPRHNGRGWEFWNPGTGWRGWVDDDGTPIPNEPGEPEIDPGDTVRINTNDDGLGHWELNHFFFDPQKTRQDAVTPNDCYEFVGKVRKIARDTHVYLASSKGTDMVQSFMDKLARSFTEYATASELGIGLAKISGNEYDQHDDVGFRSEFQDHTGPNYSINQVRHAVGGLIAGYLRIPSSIMDRREVMSTPSGQADTRLNRVTMPMGAQLRGPSGGSKAADLADWIRTTLCGPLRRN